MKGIALMLETVLALLLAWVLVFVVPLRRIQMLFGTIIEPGLDGAISPNPEAARARAVAWRVLFVANRLPWHSTCLVRALAGGLLMRRRGIMGAVIRFGVKREAGALTAHAWLLLNGEILLGGEEAASYVPLADMGPRTTKGGSPPACQPPP